MSQDPLRGVIDSIRTQLQAELDAQLASLERQHAEALEAARREARAEADARWAADMERLRAESEARLQAALADAAAQAEQRLAAEQARVRAETEQETRQSVERAREEAAAAARAEGAQALERERAAHAERLAGMQRELEEARKGLVELEEARKGLVELEEAREGLAELEQARTKLVELDNARERLAALEQARERAETERRQEASESAARLAERGAAERQSQLAAAERLLNSVRAISTARSLSDVLAALAEGAAAEVSRAAVLVPAGPELEGFRASGFSPERIRHTATTAGEDVLRTAMQERRAVPIVPGTAPAFAHLAPERAGLAAPITVGGRAVAVLYADNGLAASPEVPAAWPEAIQVLCLHASAALAHLTAVRTAQAARLMRPAPEVAPGLASGAESEGAARRYARLLVSEIKLYNETAVRLGREKRDLLHRLRPEIERARRVYEERVPGTLARRADVFDDELCQILAGGDAALLGREAVWP